MPAPVIRVCSLTKAFRLGFWMRRVQAVRGISFEVERGDIFGFLGPNGAGKTTTIKMLMGLVAPTSGNAELLGLAVPDPKSRRKIGFLPESPYIYPYLTPTEFVEMCGRLSGMRGQSLKDRAARVIQTVGMSHAADRPARRLSKGMLQRTGLAAALVSDPELLVLDEPMSGLDPVGRKEVRDLIIDERRAGRTIFFSSHILSDVETLCDRVAILQSGNVIVSGRLDELLRRDASRGNVVVSDISDQVLESLRRQGITTRRVAERWILDVEGRDALQTLLAELLSAHVTVLEVTQHQETLEDLFMRHNIGTEKARQESAA
jgi:ABC-2 type transport system ATP-binding protein